LKLILLNSTNLQGRKKTTTITKACCHGFIRQRHGFCEKIDLKSISDTAGELGCKEFVKFAENNALNEIMQSNVTIFLPNDESMKELTQNSVDNNQVALPEYLRGSDGKNEVPMKNFILNHISKGWTNIEDVDNEQILTNEFDNLTIRMNVFPKIIARREISRDDEFRYLYTANCVKISKPNKFATNGIVHQVEKVLMPVTKNLMDIIKDREDMTILRTALEKTKLDSMLSDVAGTKQYTIFAPTDSAFEKIDPQFKRKIKEGAGCAESE
jgi:transforming growth factor-beta-induced protein